MILTYTDKV